LATHILAFTAPSAATTSHASDPGLTRVRYKQTLDVSSSRLNTSCCDNTRSPPLYLRTISLFLTFPLFSLIHRARLLALLLLASLYTFFLPFLLLLLFCHRKTANAQQQKSTRDPAAHARSAASSESAEIYTRQNVCGLLSLTYPKH
jgi:hypothetical protein